MNENKNDIIAPDVKDENASAIAEPLNTDESIIESEIVDATDSVDPAEAIDETEPEFGTKSIELDLSSIKSARSNDSSDKTSNGSDANEDDRTVHASGSPENLYRDTVSLLELGDISTDTAITLLKKAGQSGSAQAYIYLGNLYSNESNELYNPAIAFEHFTSAARLETGEGYYHLGLCYNTGLGCEASPDIAFENFLKGSSLGSADCVCALGICYEFGIGCDIDYTAAAELYSRAAKQDHATAICNLGGCYLYGHGVAQDKEKAVELFQRGSELNSDVAECRLGVCLEYGEGCEKDEDAALACYEVSASKGNAVALYRLALCYENGIGTEQNFAKAFNYYNLSADAGQAEAMYASAMMSKNGKGTKKDHIAAYKMLSLAAKAEYSPAEYELGNCHFEGIGTVKNQDAAFKRYMRAYQFDNNNANAAFKLGLCALNGFGTEKNEKEAFDWFCRGTELGSCSAAYMKGECFFFGVGITEEKAVAAMCFEKSISLSQTPDEAIPAMLALAQSLEYGYGIPKDLSRARNLYSEAAENGNIEALYQIGLSLSMGSTDKSDNSPRNLILRSARMEYIPAMLTMGIFAEEGRGVPRNIGDAEKWYYRVVDAELPKSPKLYVFPNRFYENVTLCTEAKTEAQYRLGMILASKQVSAQNYINAFEYIAMAASLSHEDAQIEVTRFHMHGGDLKHYYEGETFKTNRKYSPDKDKLGTAMNRLGDSYFDGKTLVNKNITAAVRCYKIAAEYGNADACYSYGWCLRHGVGITENDSESLKWLKLGADKGNVHAAYSYGLCCEEGAGTGIKNLREARSYYRKAAVAGHTEAGKRYMALSSEQY